MKQDVYFEIFAKMSHEEVETTNRKNRDYAGPDDAFKNFRLIETLTNGRVNTADGILVRMSDKLSRVGTLLGAPPQVVEESLDDTLKDLAVYAKILRLFLLEEKIVREERMKDIEFTSGMPAGEMPAPQKQGPPEPKHTPFVRPAVSPELKNALKNYEITTAGKTSSGRA